MRRTGRRVWTGPVRLISKSRHNPPPPQGLGEMASNKFVVCTNQVSRDLRKRVSLRASTCGGLPIVPIARYSARQIVRHRWEQPVVAACGTVPVAATVPIFPAGTYWHYRGTIVSLYLRASDGIIRSSDGRRCDISLV